MMGWNENMLEERFSLDLTPLMSLHVKPLGHIIELVPSISSSYPQRRRIV